VAAGVTVGGTTKLGTNAVLACGLASNQSLLSHCVQVHHMDVNYRRPSDGLTCLMAAAAEDAIEVVRFLVEDQHVDMFAVDVRGLTAVHIAVLHCSSAAFDYLMNCMPNLDALRFREVLRGISSQGATIFHQAAISSCGEAVLQRIVEAIGSKEVVATLVNSVDAAGCTPLSHQCSGSSDNPGAVMWYIVAGADIAYCPVSYTEYTLDYYTPLMRCLFRGHRESFEVLMRRHVELLQQGSHLGPNPNECGAMLIPFTGSSPMRVACERRRPVMLRVLLEYGQMFSNFDVNQRGCSELPTGHTPLMAACFSGSFACVQLLLEHGANPNMWCGVDGATPLSLAIKSGHKPIVSLLLDWCMTDPNYYSTDSRWAMPPICEAIHAHQHDIVDLILAHADVSDHSVSGNGIAVPLIVALEADNTHAVQALLGRDDIRLENVDALGRTALSFAIEAGMADVALVIKAKLQTAGVSAHPLIDSVKTRDLDALVACLRSGSCDVNATEPTRLHSPVHLAVLTGSAAALQLLLDVRSVNVNLRDRAFMTPLMLAAIFGNSECVKLLLAHPDIDPNAGRAYCGADGFYPLYAAVYCIAVSTYLPSYCVCVRESAVQQYHYLETLRLLLAHPKTQASRPVASLSWSYVPAHGAIDGNNRGVLHMLCSHDSFDANAEGAQGSLLLRAIEKGSDGLCGKLLTCINIDVNFRSNYSAPLLLAAKLNRVVVVRWLLQCDAIDVGVVDSAGDAEVKFEHESKRSCLHFAANEGHTVVLKLLLEHAKMTSVLMNARSKHKFTPLMMAARGGHLAAVRLLVEAGAQYELLLPVNHSMRVYTPMTARLLALEQGHVCTAEYLLEQEQIAARALREQELVAMKQEMDDIRLENRRLRKEQAAQAEAALVEAALHQEQSERQTALQSDTVTKAELADSLARIQLKADQSNALLVDRIGRLEGDVALLMEKFNLGTQYELAERYIRNSPRLKAFYNALQTKLTQFFLGYLVLASGMVTKADSDVDTVRGMAFDLLGELIPFGVGGLVMGAVEYGIGVVKDEHDEKVLQLVLRHVTNMDHLSNSVRTTAMLTCFRYEAQILKLVDTDTAAQFAECVIAQYFSALKGKFELRLEESLCSQLMLSLMVSGRVQRWSIFPKNVPLETTNNALSWTDAGIFGSCGIIDRNRQLYKNKASADDMYGYCVGSPELAKALSFDPTGTHNPRKHPLQDNPFRYEEDPAAKDSPAATTWVEFLQGLLVANAFQGVLGQAVGVRQAGVDLFLVFNEEVKKTNLRSLAAALLVQWQALDDGAVGEILQAQAVNAREVRLQLLNESACEQFSEYLQEVVPDFDPNYTWPVPVTSPCIATTETTATSRVVTALAGAVTTAAALVTWVPDEQRTECMLCSAEFTFLRRRHHCRKCGRCVCMKCAPEANARPIVELGMTAPVRHCKECYKNPALVWA